MKKNINEILTTKKQKYLVLLTVILLLVAVGMFSYAFTGNINYVGLNTNKISNCSIDVSFKDSNPVRLTASYPMDYGTAKEYDPYTFYIKSNDIKCDDLKYKISMASICSSCKTSSCSLGDGQTCNCASGYQIDESLINYELKNVNTGEVITGEGINNLGEIYVLSGVETITYEMRMWIDEEATNSDLYVDGNSANLKNYCGKLNVELFTKEPLGKPEDSGPNVELDPSGANAPKLATNMIPVIYDSGNNTWIKADSTNTNLTWFNYTEKKWANAVTVTEVNGSRSDLVDSDIGTPIPMDRINTMWVWIPRFSATGDYETYNGTDDIGNPGAFNITFVDNNTSAHDAFDFGSAISGFWMSKFEITGSLTSACTSETCNISNMTILPNSASLLEQKVSSFFYAGRSMEQSGNPYGFNKNTDTSLDTHMLKNNEWSAVAYLTQSIYGRCTSSTSCTEVTLNSACPYDGNVNNKGNQYNVSLLSTTSCSTEEVSTGNCDYVSNVNQSTTGNIYGIYDMVGGADEYVMGVYWDGTKPWSGYDSNRNSGFNGCLGTGCSSTLENGTAYPSDNKYYNLYTTESAYTNAGLQHAMIETSLWYSDFVGYFVDGDDPWINRGGSCDFYSAAGIFYFQSFDGYSNITTGSRFSIKVN